MPHSPIFVLNTPAIRAALRQAWLDSNPGVTGGHEEGGFVIQDATGNLDVLRWPKGIRNSIRVPLHENCKINDNLIVASFHTHPNTGSDYIQEPSETDKRAVRDDPNLKDQEYIGEFVISNDVIYLITPVGRVREIADTPDVLIEE